MPKPFRQLNISQFRELVRTFDWGRQITAVHMHHTWQPDHSQYRGESTIDGMWNHHVNNNGWSDIAQHISIAPDGSIWTGRGCISPPASSSGQNGTAAAGPFMFEMIGNFDSGKDTFGGLQKQTTLAVIAALLDHFDLPVSALRFHNQLGSPKSCPGTTIDHAAFCAEVEAEAEAGRGERASVPKSRSKKKSRARSLPAAQKKSVADAATTLAGINRAWEDESATEVGCCASHGERGLFGPTWTAAEKEKLSRFVINMRAGRLVESGSYTTTEDDVRELFGSHLPAALAQARSEGRPLRVLFWAHGGLVKEKDALRYALDHIDDWEKAGVYPIYFVWETSLKNTLKDIIFGRGGTGERGVFDVTDAALEKALHGPGNAVWGEMKEYAAAGVAADGAARLAARELAAFANEAGDDALYWACGHSAGSIFHSHFLPCLAGLGGPAISDLFLLAPAITVGDFNSRLAGEIGPGRPIARSTMFTMDEETELDDTVSPFYRKSLLYFVSRACEPVRKTPILGLEVSVRADPVAARLYGLSAPSTVGEVIWSPSSATGGTSTTRSTTHGGFDNDRFTLNSLARRITGDHSITPFLTDRTTVPAVAGGRARKALCIGIDGYPTAPLSGCINDARQWEAALTELGYTTTLLTDAAATRSGILGAIAALIDGSVAGDSLVFQYAGHGTRVTDVDGDEKDGIDEALVPFDYQSGEFLIDDDLGKVYDTLPPGVSLTLFMDCCHSGSINRLFAFGAPPAAGGERARFLHVPEPIMAKHVAKRTAELAMAPAPRRTRSAGTAAVKGEVLFAACQDIQTAKEINGHGYFTTTACPLLVTAAGTMTHAEFLAAVAEKFPLPADSQLPRLDCAAAKRDQILLATAARDAAPGAPDVLAPPAGAQPVDAQMLVETMRDYMSILKRLV